MKLLLLLCQCFGVQTTIRWLLDKTCATFSSVYSEWMTKTSSIATKKQLNLTKNTTVVFHSAVFRTFQVLMWCCLFFLSWRYSWQHVTSWPAANQVTTLEVRWPDLGFTVSLRCFVSVRLSASFPPPTEPLRQPCMFVTDVLLFSVRVSACVRVRVFPFRHVVVVSTAPLRREQTCVSQVKGECIILLCCQICCGRTISVLIRLFGSLWEGVPVGWMTACVSGIATSSVARMRFCKETRSDLALTLEPETRE